MPIYPVNEFGPLMPGLVIGGLGIFHVFLAQFAIGGGMLMCYFQWLAQTGRCETAREFTDGFFKLLVLISFVLGAVTGVGMWFTTIQISARTIGVMVDEFHWLWATEWTFFCLEIASGYCFYRYGAKLGDTARLRLLVIYSLAAWFSLFWINGILSWQLTPGAFAQTHNVWDGFFNPTFFPSLVFRTITSMTIAALAACVVINLMPNLTREQRADLIHRTSHFLAPMVLMPALGGWFLLAMPADSRSWVLGGSVAMTLFFALGVLCSMMIGAYALLGLLRQHLFINGATATLLLALAFLATAGGEFVREGSRKPFTIREFLYSNSITPAEAGELRQTGALADDPYPLRNPGTDDPVLRHGAKVFRRLCSVCHTLDGSNGLMHLAGTWTSSQMRMNIAQLQRTKPFMPPFAGNADDVEAIAQWLEWHLGQRDAGEAISAEQQQQIAQWLDEVGTEPGIRLVLQESP